MKTRVPCSMSINNAINRKLLYKCEASKIYVIVVTNTSFKPSTNKTIKIYTVSHTLTKHTLNTHKITNSFHNHFTCKMYPLNIYFINYKHVCRPVNKHIILYYAISRIRAELTTALSIFLGPCLEIISYYQ